MMRNLNNYLMQSIKLSLSENILERLKINKDTKVNTYEFSDEELRHDYEVVAYATTKAEKMPIAKKYGVTVMRIKDIQQVILGKLRDNRHNKKDFTRADVRNFFNLDIPERYNELATH